MDQFGGKSKKKLNSVEFMEFVFSKSGSGGLKFVCISKVVLYEWLNLENVYCTQTTMAWVKMNFFVAFRLVHVQLNICHDMCHVSCVKCHVTHDT